MSSVEKKFFVSYVLVLVLITPKSLPALILRVLASFVNSKTIHQWPTTQSCRRHEPPYLLDGNSKDGDGDHSWTYLFND